MGTAFRPDAARRPGVEGRYFHDGPVDPVLLLDAPAGTAEFTRGQVSGSRSGVESEMVEVPTVQLARRCRNDSMKDCGFVLGMHGLAAGWYPDCVDGWFGPERA